MCNGCGLDFARKNGLSTISVLPSAQEQINSDPIAGELLQKLKACRKKPVQQPMPEATREALFVELLQGPFWKRFDKEFGIMKEDVDVEDREL